MVTATVDLLMPPPVSPVWQSEPPPLQFRYDTE